jgi:signal transduction histidine kinase
MPKIHRGSAVTSRAEDYCRFLQEIGFPAARVKTERGELIESNESFRKLFAGGLTQYDANSFIESVLPGITSIDRGRLDAVFTNREPVQLRVQIRSLNGQTSDFEMRAIAVIDSTQSGKSIICVFIPIAGPVFERIRNEQVSEGEDSERRRIRNELHKGISQQLLGAAFACKVLATRIGRLNDELGREAADLADLVNATVTQLQTMVRDRNPQ